MPETPPPSFLAPMLSTLVKEPFDSPDWIFESKLDGYRAVAVIGATGKPRIWSRNHLPLEQKFPTVLDSVNRLSVRSTILDGEIVALDSQGIPRFQLLQKWQKRPTAPVVYYLFDVLWSEGRDFTSRIKSRPQQQFVVGGFTEGKGSRRMSFGALLFGAVV